MPKNVSKIGSNRVSFLKRMALDAIGSRDVDALRSALSKLGSPDTPLKSSNATAAGIAARHGQLEILKFLHEEAGEDLSFQETSFKMR